MLFFTSNLGYSDMQQRSPRIGYMDEEARAEAGDVDIRRELRQALKPEFVNRVRMIHFNRLTLSSAERILDLELERIARRYREVHGLELMLDPSARQELIRRGFSADYGARHLAATLEAVCNVPVAKRIREDDRRGQADRDELLSWLRQMRAGDRPYQADEVRARVLGMASARLDYDTLRVSFDGREFRYDPERSGDAG